MFLLKPLQQKLIATLVLVPGIFCLSPVFADTFHERLINAARQQVGVTTGYDGAYRRIAYPMGDVPIRSGVCTDVLIRAYRKLGMDLQELVHKDMLAAWSSYPHSWGLKKPDSNIDHRRVPNLATFFRRQQTQRPISGKAQDYKPGDIVTWRLPGNLPHIGIVSDNSESSRPLVIHNIGGGAREEDTLFSYPITGHYRYPK